MANAAAKIDVEKLRKLRHKIDAIPEIITEDTARALGAIVSYEMRNLILKGVSPIQGRGRFPAYRGRYPRSVQHEYPSKKARPVNLALSLDFIESLTFKTYAARHGRGVEVGYFDSLSQKKEQGHREGANGQAERPTIPIESKGETFVAAIRRAIHSHIQSAISAFIKKAA